MNVQKCEYEKFKHLSVEGGERKMGSKGEREKVRWKGGRKGKEERERLEEEIQGG